MLTNYYNNSYELPNFKSLYTFDHDSFVLDIINDEDKYIDEKIYKNLYTFDQDSLSDIISDNDIQLSSNTDNQIMVKMLDTQDNTASVNNYININELTKKCLPTIIESSDISNIGYYWFPLFINAVDINSSYIIRNSHMLFGIVGSYYHSKLINLDISNSFLHNINDQIQNTPKQYTNIDLNQKEFIGEKILIDYDFYKIDLEKGLILINKYNIQTYLPLIYEIDEKHEKWLEIIKNDKLIILKYKTDNFRGGNYINITEYKTMKGRIVINYYTNKIYLYDVSKLGPQEIGLIKVIPDIIENINYEQYMKDVILHNDSGILSINFNNEYLLRVLYNGLYGEYWNIYTNIIPKHYNNIDLNLIKDYQIDIKSNDIYGNEIIDYYKLSDFNNINIINSLDDSPDNFSDNYDFKLYLSEKILVNNNTNGSFNDFSNNNLEIILKNNGRDYQIKTYNFNNEKSLFYNINDLINNFNNRIHIIKANSNSYNDSLHITTKYSITKEDVQIYTMSGILPSELSLDLLPYYNIVINQNGKTIIDFKNVLKNGFNFYDINKEIAFFDNTNTLNIIDISKNFGIDISNTTVITILYDDRVVLDEKTISELADSADSAKLLPSYDISINNILYSNNDTNLIKDYFTYDKDFEKVGNIIVKKQKIKLIDGNFNIFRKNNFKIQTYYNRTLNNPSIILNSSYLKEEDIINYDINIDINDIININIIYNDQYMNIWFINHIFLDGEFNNGSHLSNPIIVNKNNLSFTSPFTVVNENNSKISTNLNTKHLIKITYNQNTYYIKNIRNETLNMDDFVLSDTKYDINTKINVWYNSLEGPLELSFSNKKHANYIQNYMFNKNKMEKILSHENTVMPPIHFSFIN